LLFIHFSKEVRDEQKIFTVMFIFAAILTSFYVQEASCLVSPQVSAGGYHTVGLKSDGTVMAVGDNFYGQ
jgi:hypothetical protein